MEKNIFLEKAYKIHGTKYDYSLVPDKILSKDKVNIICPIHGKFSQNVNAHINTGYGCEKCSYIERQKNYKRHIQLHDNNWFLKRAHEIHDEKRKQAGLPPYDYSRTYFTKVTEKIEYDCPLHGPQIQLADSHIKGSGCKKCGIILSSKNNISKNEWIKLCHKVHDEKRKQAGLPPYDYSEIKYINSHNIVKNIICPIHGPFDQLANSHKRGHGCRKCGFESAGEKLFNTTNQAINNFQKIHGNKYDYSEMNYNGMNDYIYPICPIHGKFKVWATNHLQGTGCQKCDILKHRSSKEIELFDFLKENITEKIQSNNRQILQNRKEIDIYIPSKNIGIEFNGIRYHSELFKPNNYKTYHLQKTQECEKQGIQLIHIFEDEWLEKQEIIKSRLLNILGKSKWRLFARKLKIKQVPVSQEKYFFNRNHLQGYIPSKLCYGLYWEYKEKEYGEIKNYLISAMSFGELRKNLGSQKQDGVYEMYRFCNALNYSIPGAAQKLFKHFLKKINPKQVISYADRRWSINNEHNLYRQLGFEFDSYSKPGYFYYDGHKRINRFALRKDILVSKYNCSQKDTEEESINKLGFLRIYDCGQIKYIYNNSK